MSRPTLFEPIALFRLRRAGLLALVAIVVLLSLKLYAAALGVLLGVGIFLLNAILLYESGRSLLSREGARTGRALAAGSSIARFLMMGVALWLVFEFVCREALLGACGGLFLSQVHLHLPGRRASEAV